MLRYPHSYEQASKRRRTAQITLAIAAWSASTNGPGVPADRDCRELGACSAPRRTEAYADEIPSGRSHHRDIQQAIPARQITTEQLVRLYLARIKAYNGTCVNEPQGMLGPIQPIAERRTDQRTVYAESAPCRSQSPGLRRPQGAQHDRRRATTIRTCPTRSKSPPRRTANFARTGKLVGPLHGVVHVVQGSVRHVRHAHDLGCGRTYANDRPPDDATFVKRLRDAGAIILAKANLAEYASTVRAAPSAVRSAIPTTLSASPACRARAPPLPSPPTS